MSSNSNIKSKLSVMSDMLENAIISFMKDSKIPGASIAIVANDEIVYAKGFGARNLKLNLPVTNDTLFGFGSVSKSYTALGIMQLSQEGKLDVHDPVSKYLNFKLGKKSNPITIHHLLTHSTGLPDLGVGKILSDRFAGKESTWIPYSSWNDFYIHVNGAAEEITAEPGQRFAYSNESYTMLGQIIAKVSGMDYEEYIKEKILKPLNMNRSLLLKEEFEKEPDRMTGYQLVTEKGKLIDVIESIPPFDKFVSAAGGLISTSIDHINYLRLYMNDGVFEGKQILDANLIKEMQKLHIETELVRNAIAGFEKEGYGYGWIIIEDFLGEKCVLHQGGTDASSAFITFIQNKKIGVSIVCNSGSGGDFCALIALFINAVLLGKDPMKDLKYIGIEQKLSMLTGVYETYKAFDRVMVVKRGALLYIETEGGEPMPIIPKDDDINDFKFYAPSGAGGKMSVDFVIGKKGKISLLFERNKYNRIRDLSL